MKHFAQVRGQFDNADSPEIRVLPCFADFLDLLFRVHCLLSIGQFNVEKVFTDR
jgi:hypothetical protein